jgi:eukaryotic-like serine/threonine-protein kinase
MAVNFDLQRKLGSGHFGEVWLAVDTGLNSECALKLISPKRVANPQNLTQEAQVLKAAEHENVVRVLETGRMDDGRIYIAMEYHKRGSLEDEARGAYVDLSRAKRIMIDALRGLEFVHSKNVLHRDIKPANILVGDLREGLLSDFGLAMPAGLDLSTLGAKDYAYILHLAPEVILGKPYSVSSDIYACGVTLYRLVNGDSYLPTLLPEEIREACKAGYYPDRAKYRDFVPNPIKRLINKALEIDPAKRFRTAGEMRHALERVAVYMNWRERKLPDGVQWNCCWLNCCHEVTKRLVDGKGWSLSVRKGKSKDKLRSVTSLCQQGIPQGKVDSAARRVLQDYVLGKLR